MALKPRFEAQTATAEAATDNGDTAVADAPTASRAVETPTTAAQPAPAQAPAPTQAVAVVSSSALAVQDAANAAKNFQREVHSMKDACDFSYGNYTVFKGNNGELQEMGGSETSLGRWAKIRLIGWSDHYELSPGTQDKNSKDFVAYSKDGVTIDSVIGEDQRKFVGASCEDYLTYLRDTEGFDQAKKRKFVDMAAALLGTESGDGPVGTVIQITLSESSIPAFSKYQQSLIDNARCVAMGLPGFTLPEDPFTFFVIRELASKGNNKWTKLRFSSTLPTKL